MLTLRQAYDDLLLLIWVENSDTAPVNIRQRVLNDINAALQLMQSAGEDYFAREPVLMLTAAGQSNYTLRDTLGDNIQSVLEPIRIDSLGVPLRKLNSRGEFIAFPQVFLGQLGTSMVNSAPMAWWVESLRLTTSGQADDVLLNLYLTPTPDAVYTLQMDVIKQAPVFALTDLCNTSPFIPVPHTYTEMIFLPLARWNLMTCSWFNFPEKIPQLREDYERALRMLGINDPRRPKPDGLNSNAAHIQDSGEQAPTQQERAAA